MLSGDATSLFADGIGLGDLSIVVSMVSGIVGVVLYGFYRVYRIMASDTKARLDAQEIRHAAEIDREEKRHAAELERDAFRRKQG